MNRPDGISYEKCLCAAKFNCELSGWALLEYVLFCHVLWWIFYSLLLLITRQSAEWCCRFVTLIHGCLVSYAAITDIYTRGSNINFGNNTLTEAQKIYLSYMLSYFLFDFCWMHIFGNETRIIYVHHLTSIVIIINVLARAYGGDGVSYGVAGLEFSNPYLQLRWFLRTHGYLNKPIHTFTELWFVFLFFSIRMIGGTILLYRCVTSKYVDFAMKISFIAIYGISLVLQWQIFVFIRKKYFTAEGRRGLSLRTIDSMSPYFQRRTSDSIDEPVASYRFDEIEESCPIKKRPTLKSNLGEPSSARSGTDISREDGRKESFVKVGKHVTVEFVLSEAAASKPVGEIISHDDTESVSPRNTKALTAEIPQPEPQSQPEPEVVRVTPPAVDHNVAEQKSTTVEVPAEESPRAKVVTYADEVETRTPHKESKFKTLRKKTMKVLLRKKNDESEYRVPRDE